MAVTYLHTCDGCGKEARVEPGPFGANAQPEGWILASVWLATGGAVEVCSWSCLVEVANARAEVEA